MPEPVAKKAMVMATLARKTHRLAARSNMLQFLFAKGLGNLPPLSAPTPPKTNPDQHNTQWADARHNPEPVVAKPIRQIYLFIVRIFFILLFARDLAPFRIDLDGGASRFFKPWWIDPTGRRGIAFVGVIRDAVLAGVIGKHPQVVAPFANAFGIQASG